MDRNGIVVAELGANRVRIRLVRHTACGSCGACHLGDDAKNINLAAINTAGASVGDRVSVALPTASVLSAAFILYMLPLAGLFAGIAAGLLSGLSEAESFGIGLALLALVFAGIRLMNRRFARDTRYVAEVTGILESETELFPIERT